MRVQPTRVPLQILQRALNRYNEELEGDWRKKPASFAIVFSQAQVASSSCFTTSREAPNMRASRLSLRVLALALALCLPIALRAQVLSPNISTPSPRPGTPAAFPDRTRTLNILLILPYAYDDMLADPVANVYTIYTHVRSLEVAAETAITELMSLRTFLPDVLINTVKVNNWNTAVTRPPATSLITSGGFSAVALYEAAQSNQIAGVYGDLFSKTTVFTAAMASYLKLPYCGSTQSTKTLSSRKRYPYFYRTNSGRGYGRAYSLLLRSWNVRRFAVIQFFDDISVTQAQDVISEATAMGITVPYVGKVTSEMYSKKEWGNLFDMIRFHRCSYIYVSGLDVHTRDVYHAAHRAGVVGPDFVWAGYNLPVLANGLNNSLVEGFVYLMQGARFQNTFVYQKFVRGFWAKSSGRLNETAHKSTPSSFAGKGYDCMKSMLIGFNKLSDEYPTWTNDSFVDPNNKDLLLPPKAYSMTGYVDLNEALFELDEFGSQLFPVTFLSLNLESLTNPSTLVPERSWAIASSDGKQMLFSKVNQPFFFGGSRVPPSSSAVITEDILAPTHPLQVILRLLQTLHTLLFFAALLTLLNSHKRDLVRITPLDPIPAWAWDRLHRKSLFPALSTRRSFFARASVFSRRSRSEAGAAMGRVQEEGAGRVDEGDDGEEPGRSRSRTTSFLLPPRGSMMQRKSRGDLGANAGADEIEVERQPRSRSTSMLPPPVPRGPLMPRKSRVDLEPSVEEADEEPQPRSRSASVFPRAPMISRKSRGDLGIAVEEAEEDETASPKRSSRSVSILGSLRRQPSLPCDPFRSGADVVLECEEGEAGVPSRGSSLRSRLSASTEAEMGKPTLAEWAFLAAAFCGSGPGWWLYGGRVFGWDTNACREVGVWIGVAVGVLIGTVLATSYWANCVHHNPFVRSPRFSTPPAFLTVCTVAAVIPNIVLALVYSRVAQPISAVTFVDRSVFFMTCTPSAASGQLAKVLGVLFFVWNSALAGLAGVLVPREGKGRTPWVWVLRVYNLASLFIFALEYLFSPSAIKIVLQLCAITLTCLAADIKVIHHLYTPPPPTPERKLFDCAAVVRHLGAWRVRLPGTFGWGEPFRCNVAVLCRGSVCCFFMLPSQPGSPLRTRHLRAQQTELVVAAHASGTLALDFAAPGRGGSGDGAHTASAVAGLRRRSGGWLASSSHVEGVSANETAASVWSDEGFQEAVANVRAAAGGGGRRDAVRVSTAAWTLWFYPEAGGRTEEMEAVESENGHVTVVALAVRSVVVRIELEPRVGFSSRPQWFAFEGNLVEDKAFVCAHVHADEIIDGLNYEYNFYVLATYDSRDSAVTAIHRLRSKDQELRLRAYDKDSSDEEEDPNEIHYPFLRDISIVDLPPHTRRIWSGVACPNCVDGVGEELAYYSHEELLKYSDLIEADINRDGLTAQLLEEREKVKRGLELRRTIDAIVFGEGNRGVFAIGN
ncbi:hypothetical protein HDU96_009189 [Phlyctochytrium bullatum]|nr:hypothetical protein HDU96_009189 [Phlyctochytrium bullatum]